MPTSRSPRPASHYVLVSVHDVTPAHRERIQRIFDVIAEFGVKHYAILLVPNWHGAWPLERHREFVGELRQRQEAGAEIFLHGLRHDEVGLKRSLGHEIRTYGRTNREGEFVSLSPSEAGRRIDLGLQVFQECGLNPVGFIPPAWLHGRDALRILRERRLEITESFWTVRDTDSGRRLYTLPISWSTQKPWRSVACGILAATRCQLEVRRRIVRVAIHPPDIDVPSVARSLRATLGALLETREAVSYRRALSTDS